MSVLLMRLAGPMQSWGIRSRFTNRDTGLEPSRSGVIGLLCAALGRSREQPLADFLPLKMAVRVDREGRLMRDYHTAQRIRSSASATGAQETVLSERFYLADANFLVALEGDHALLTRLDNALRRPVWPLFLGRKAFVPSLPVPEGVRDGELLALISDHGWRKQYPGDKPPDKLRGVVEVEYGAGEPRADVPLSFVSRDRRFGVRHVRDHYFPLTLVLEPIPESPHVSHQTNSQCP
jgi:CRISPR system Cascade subunit CasD